MGTGEGRVAVDEDVIRACGQVVFGNEGSLRFSRGVITGMIPFGTQPAWYRSLLLAATSKRFTSYHIERRSVAVSLTVLLCQHRFNHRKRHVGAHDDLTDCSWQDPAHISGLYLFVATDEGQDRAAVKVCR